MSERKPYPSDLSDEQWSLVEPVITAWKDRHRSVSGHHGAYDMREIVNAILYQGRTGCQLACIPHDPPPESATYYYFAAWRDDRTGQVIAVAVLAASTHDNAADIVLLDQAVDRTGHSVRKALIDQGFKNQVVEHGAGQDIEAEIVARNPHDKGFVPQLKRRRVERTYGILIRHQREHPHLANGAGAGSVNIQALLEAPDLQEDAARALADDLRAQTEDPQTRPRKAETHLGHLTTTRKTVTGLTDRLPAAAPDLPDHRKLGTLTEADTDNFTRKQ